MVTGVQGGESEPEFLPPSTAEHVKEYVGLQQQELLKVLQPLQDRLGDALTWQTSQLGGMQKNLLRTVRSRVKNQQAALESIGDDLRAHLTNATAEQQVQLNHSILTMGGPSEAPTRYLPRPEPDLIGPRPEPWPVPTPEPRPPIIYRPPPGYPPPEPVPCPECGQTCNRPVTINVACPACNCQAICAVQIDYVVNVVVQVVQQVIVALNCQLNLSLVLLVQLIAQLTNQIIINNPPPPPPAPTEPAPQQQQLGRDCDHPLWISICIDPGASAICPAPLP
jgi:hypothetical protein